MLEVSALLRDTFNQILPYGISVQLEKYLDEIEVEIQLLNVSPSEQSALQMISDRMLWNFNGKLSRTKLYVRLSFGQVVNKSMDKLGSIRYLAKNTSFSWFSRSLRISTLSSQVCLSLCHSPITRFKVKKIIDVPVPCP